MRMCPVPGQATVHAHCALILWLLDTNQVTKNKQAVTNALNEGEKLFPLRSYSVKKPSVYAGFKPTKTECVTFV